MRLNLKNNTKRVLLAGVLGLAIVGVSTGLAFKMHSSVSAASTQSAAASDGETNDDNTPQNTSSTQDNGKDDGTKAAATNVQDNGQDGEANDSALQ